MKHRFQKGDRVRVVEIVLGNISTYGHLIGEEFEIDGPVPNYYRSLIDPSEPEYRLVGRPGESWFESELELAEASDIPAAPPLSDLFG